MMKRLSGVLTSPGPLVTAKDVNDSVATSLGAGFECDDAANGHDQLEYWTIDNDVRWRHGLSRKDQTNLIRNFIIDPNAAWIPLDAHEMILHVVGLLFP